MGWKNVKEHYGITGSNRIVHVVGGEILIGVGYINDLMRISADGVLVKKDQSLGSADFARYAREMEADPQKLRDLVQSPDAFTASNKVFTYDGGHIVEKFCEKAGWPNVTHDGCLMYDNTFSLDRDAIVARARANAVAGVELGQRQIEQAKRELEKAQECLREQQAALASLDREFPEEA